ncbi:hypothetical protein ACWFRF_14275 [Nocardia sp. NPDC055165]|uniref:hypothetical protein n=1 Tax=Nocardia sp. NPDC060220 TaxID=3347076 RepID=UPI00364E7138
MRSPPAVASAARAAAAIPRANRAGLSTRFAVSAEVSRKSANPVRAKASGTAVSRHRAAAACSSANSGVGGMSAGRVPIFIVVR